MGNSLLNSVLHNYYGKAVFWVFSTIKSAKSALNRPILKKRVLPSYSSSNFTSSSEEIRTGERPLGRTSERFMYIISIIENPKNFQNKLLYRNFVHKPFLNIKRMF